MNRAVFLDRDGTINEEVNYLSRGTDFRMIPGAAAAIRALKDNGWLVIVVTNQSGIARGYYTEQDVHAIHDHMRHELLNVGTSVDAVYYCPHHPADGCDCRKPATGLYVQAVTAFNIDLDGSYIVGDKLSDLISARQLGCRTILVLTGHGPREVTYIEERGFRPDYIVADLSQAVRQVILHQDMDSQ